MASWSCSRRDRPLIGRERELAVLIAAVTGPAGRGAIVAGDAGVGKTRLVEQVMEDLVEQGWTVLLARGDPTRSEPFGALGSLLADHDDDPLPRAGVAGEPGSAEVAARARSAAMLRRGLEQLSEQKASRPPVLIADDLHAFDPASAVLLQQAVLGGQARLIGCYRVGEPVPDAVTALWKDEVVERLDLLPLARAECDELVERLMDGPVAGQARARLWRWTEGNPLLVTEIVVDSRGRGCWSRSRGLWRLDTSGNRARHPVASPSLAVILRDRTHGLPPAIDDVVDALALAGHLPVGVLEHLVGRRTLALAERSRLTRTGTEAGRAVVTLQHPLYGDLRRAELSERRAAAVRARVLAVFERYDEVAPGDVPLLARWYVETGRSGPRAAALLSRGAELAWAANDLRTAATLARRALEVEPNERSRLVLVNSLARLGESGDLHLVVAELLESAVDDTVRSEALINYASVLFHHADRPDDAEALLCDAAAATSDGCCRKRLVKQAALLRLQRGDLRGAEVLVRPLLNTTDPQGAKDAAMVLAPVRLLQGQIREALAQARRGRGTPCHPADDRPDDALGPPAALEGAVGLAEVGAWAESDRLRDAEAAVGQVMTTLDIEADPFTGGLLAHRMGRITRLRGRLRTAARWFREAVDAFDATGRGGFASWALAGLSEMQAQLGDRLGALATAEECARRPRTAIGLGVGDVARCLAWALVADGKVDEAADRLARAARTSLLAGEVLHAAHGFHDLVRIGHAERAADRLAELAERSDSLVVAAFARHARATVAADAAGLEWVARRFASLGCDLHAAEVWAQVAGVSQAVGRERRGAAAHRECLACRQVCEGARTPLLAASTGTITLSRREREVARLARSGMPRRAIAARLVISPRTVDSHLQRIYRKLGVEDREGLALVLPIELATNGGDALAQ